jgi:hypothetical protein
MMWKLRNSLMSFIMILVILPIHAFGAEADTVIGAVEDIVLMPWNISLPARIDTGAATTSLDARELVVLDNNWVEFLLSEAGGGKKIKLPVKGWKQVKSSGAQQRRPLVELDICIGDKLLHIEANLMDRSRVQYPLLIGRNVLENGYLVDVRKTRVLPPRCRELSRP